MLMWRAKELLEGGSELLRAELELASGRLRRLLVGSALMAATGIVALVGLGVLLAAATIAMAGEIGWVWSLVVIGVCLVAVSAIGLAVAMAKAGPRDEQVRALESRPSDPEAEIAEAKERLHNAATPGMDPEYGPPSGRPTMGGESPNGAVAFAARNPLLVGSAAFLAVSIFGPKRVVRLASRGVAMAGLAASLLEQVGPSDDRPRDKEAGRVPPPGPRPTAPGARPAAQGRRGAVRTESAVYPIGMNARGPAAPRVGAR